MKYKYFSRQKLEVRSKKLVPGDTYQNDHFCF